MEHKDSSSDGSSAYDLNTLEQRFYANIALTTQRSKLTLLKTTTDAALLGLRYKSAEFDLIYIDASHVAIDVLHDAVLSWRMLVQGGTLVFDDYGWKGYLEDCFNPRIAIKAFAQCVEWEGESWVAEGLSPQMWVRKVGRRMEGTANPDGKLLYAEGDEAF